MLATTAQHHPFNWEDQLPKVCMAYNTSVHTSTRYTPFFLMFGRQARMPIDLMYGTNNEKAVPTTEYAASTRKALEEAYRCVRENSLHHMSARKTTMTRRSMADQLQLEILYGFILWLFRRGSPRNSTIRGRVLIVSSPNYLIVTTE